MKVVSDKGSKKNIVLKVIGFISAIALASSAALYMLSENNSSTTKEGTALADFNIEAGAGKIVLWEHPGYKGRSIELDS